MSLSHRLEPLPEIETGLSRRDETLLLGFALIVGLTFVAPVLSIALDVPALVFVVIVGSLYGVAALLLRRLLVGSFVAFVATAVFNANVPLADADYLGSIAGALGPRVQLVHLPLVAALVLTLAMGPRKVLRGVTRAEILFGAFVGWSVLAALFGATARTDVALYFSLLMAQVFLTVLLFRSAVQRFLRFRTVAELFAGTVLAQSVFAAVQFINGGTFGVSTLGEAGDEVIATFSLGPFGTLSAGTYVSGFTGGQFILASLIVLAVPTLLAVAIEYGVLWRTAGLAGALFMIAVLRATAGDAARGGLLVAGSLFVVAVVSIHRTFLWEQLRQLSGGAFERSVRFGWDLLFTGVVSVVSLVLVLYPSSTSGASSQITEVEGGGGAAASTANSSQPTTTAAGSGGGSAPAPASRIDSVLENLSIPFFSLNNLGIRIQQYVGGLDLFVRHPLFGIGGGNFRYYATEYGLPRPLPLHNIYIAVLAETGLPGFLLYAGSLGLVLVYGTRTVLGDAAENLALVGVLCGLTGYLAFGFFDVLQLIKPTAVFPFAVLVGAVLGQYRTATQQ